MSNNENEAITQWQIPEYREHIRSRRWYITTGIVFVLFLIYSLFTANFLFTLLLVITAIIITFQDRQPAPKITFAITTDGIAIGSQFYDYKKLQSFWLYYEPDEAKTLFFEFKNKIRPRLAVPLLNTNPLDVRSDLLKFLVEDITRENEPVSEQLSRLLKL